MTGRATDAMVAAGVEAFERCEGRSLTLEEMVRPILEAALAVPGVGLLVREGPHSDIWLTVPDDIHAAADAFRREWGGSVLLAAAAAKGAQDGEVMALMPFEERADGFEEAGQAALLRFMLGDFADDIGEAFRREHGDL